MSIVTAADAAHFLAWLAELPDDATFAPVGMVESDEATDNTAVNEAEAKEVIEDAHGDDDWVYPSNEKNQAYIVKCMCFTFNQYFPKDYSFSKQQLLALKPVHIRRWLSQLAYHTPTPGPNDRPLYYRSGSLKKAKGGISFFHPNKHVPWIEPHGGNPTQHRSITELIQKVHKFEIRGIGKKANDKRPYTREEFQKKIQLFRQHKCWNHHCKYVTMTLWCKHLILRADDACNFKMDAPHGSHEYDFALFTRTKWSKNVTSFHNCPPQIILGSKRWSDCMQLHLGVFLEAWIHRNNPQVKYLFSECSSDKAPANLKAVYFTRCEKVVWGSDEFKALYDQVGADDDRRSVGTHSTRKYAASEAAKQGASHPQVEYRGRWVGRKGGSVCSTRYIDTNNPYDDAFVASLLCEDGAIAYELKQGVEVEDEWLFQVVVPNIRDRYQNDHRLCRVLGLALLWGSFNEETRLAMRLGTAIRNRFIDDKLNAEQPAPEYNPVQKVSLHIYNSNGRLNVMKIRPSVNEGVAGAQAEASVEETNTTAVLSPDPTSNHANVVHLMTRMNNLEQSVNEKYELLHLQLNQQQIQQHAFMSQQFQTVNNNVRRYGGTITSAFAHQARQNPGPLIPEPINLFGAYGTMDRRATLHPRPRDLIQLWAEWTTGIDGRKPAKDFTTAERNNRVGGIKQKFYRRLLIWQTQARLVDGGMSLIAANNRITQITGARTISGVISRLIDFKKAYKDDGGTHPQLRNR